MAYDKAEVTIVGNVVDEPTVRGDGDAQRTTFTVAVNSGNAERGNERKDYFDVTAFRSLGANVARTLKKGQRVVVTGALRTYKVEATPKGGDEVKNITKTSVNAYVVAPSLEFAEAQVVANPRPGAESATPAAQPAPAPEAAAPASTAPPF